MDFDFYDLARPNLGASVPMGRAASVAAKTRLARHDDGL
jgi:hypothetical protein